MDTFQNLTMLNQRSQTENATRLYDILQKTKAQRQKSQ